MPPCEDFDAFFAEEFPRVVAFLYRIFYGQAGNGFVEDCAVDALLEAYSRWGKLVNPRAYIRTVAKRKLRDMILRDLDGVRRAVTGGWLAPEVSRDPTRLVEAAIEQQELLKHLPDRQREVMAWTMDDFTPQEIADELGMSPETVRSTLRHARDKLKQLYKQQLDPRGNEGGA
jgi:RNA polymerase sigma-70 factor (ECF subfamily)